MSFVRTLERFGCPGRDLGLGHRGRRVVADDHLVGNQEAEELVPGDQGARDAGRHRAQAQLVRLCRKVGGQPD